MPPTRLGASPLKLGNRGVSAKATEAQQPKAVAERRAPTVVAEYARLEKEMRDVLQRAPIKPSKTSTPSLAVIEEAKVDEPPTTTGEATRLSASSASIASLQQTQYHP